MKCHLCDHRFAIRTDPQNTTCASGPPPHPLSLSSPRSSLVCTSASRARYPFSVLVARSRPSLVRTSIVMRVGRSLRSWTMWIT
jgi:hypothetical protein